MTAPATKRAIILSENEKRILNEMWEKLNALPARAVPEWIGKAPDSIPPPRVRLRVFARYDGKCHRSGRKIRPGMNWQLDHVVALINGGENRESNLAPILAGKVHREKTAADVAEKSKVARMRAKHLGIYPKPLRKMQSRPFPKRAAHRELVP